MAKQNTKLALGNATTLPVSKLHEAVLAAQKKLDSLEKLKLTAWKASTELEEVGNIRDIKDPEFLRKVAGSIIAKQDFYFKGAAAIGEDPTKITPFKVSGHTAEEWLFDLTLVRKIAEKEKATAKLKAFCEKGQTFLSEKDKEKIFFNEFSSFLNSPEAETLAEPLTTVEVMQ